MRLTLRLMSLAGVIVFGFALAMTFLSPISVERGARSFIQSQIERQVREELGLARDKGQATRAGRLAEALVDRHDKEIRALREQLAISLKAQVAVGVARMQDPSCECRKRMLQGFESAMRLRLSALERAEPQLRRFIEGRYSEIVADLVRDLRIFTGANLLAFLVLLGLSFAKPNQVRQLFVPGVLLVATAVTASALYVFGQNWFFTLLYGNFVGLAYAVWLLLIYGLFCDIVFFKARITKAIADAAVSPC